jgi:hypothetical protein
MYRMRKFVRRNRGMVGTLAVLGITMALGTVGSVLGWLNTRSALTVAEEQRTAAKQEAVRAVAAESLATERQRQVEREMALARAVGDFQDAMLRQANAGDAAGDKLSVLHLTDESLKRLDEGLLKGQPLVEAAVRNELGRTLWSMGRSEDAQKVLRRSLELVRGSGVEKGPELIWPLKNLVEILDNARRLQEEEPLAKELFELASSAQMNRWEAGLCMSYYGVCLARQNRPAEAYTPLVRSFEAFDKAELMERKRVGEWHEELIMLILVTRELCDVCRVVGKPDESRKYRVSLNELTGATPPRADEPLPRRRELAKPVVREMPAVQSPWDIADVLPRDMYPRVEVRALATNSEGDVYALGYIPGTPPGGLVRMKKRGDSTWITLLLIPWNSWAIAPAEQGKFYLAGSIRHDEGSPEVGSIVEYNPDQGTLAAIDVFGYRACHVDCTPAGDLIAVYEVVPPLPPADNVTPPPLRTHSSIVRMRKANAAEFITLLDTSRPGTPYAGWIARWTAIVPSGPSSGIYVAGAAYDSVTDTKKSRWGVLKSGDFGNNWSVVDQFALEADATSVTRALISDNNGKVFVAGMAMQNSLQRWIVRSSADGGATWQTEDDFQMAPGKNNAANALALDRAGNVLAAGWGQDANGHQHGLARINAGNKWHLIEDYATDDSPHMYNAVTSDLDGRIYAGGVATEVAWLIRADAPPASDSRITPSRAPPRRP